MPGSTLKQIPMPIEAAQKALAILRVEDAALAASVEKILPAYAMKFSEMRVEALLDDARRGSDFLKDITTINNNPPGFDYTALKNKFIDERFYKMLADGQLEPACELISSAMKKQKKNFEEKFPEYLSFMKNEENSMSDRMVVFDIIKSAYKEAVDRRNFDIADIIYSKKIKPVTPYDLFETAAADGDMIRTDYLLGQYELSAHEKSALLHHALEKGQPEWFKKYQDWGNFDQKSFYSSLKKSLLRGHIDSFDCAMEAFKKRYGNYPQLSENFIYTDYAAHLLEKYPQALTSPATILHMKATLEIPAHILYLLAQSARIKEPDIDFEYRHLVDDYAQRILPVWQKIARCAPPQGLEEKDPALFYPLPFASVRKILNNEGYEAASGNLYAYNTTALFGTKQRIMEYFERWADMNNSQAMHDIIQHIKIPEGVTKKSLQNWADACIKQGPEMAKLVKFADKLPSPEKSNDGKTWSLSKTRAKVAEFAYANGKMNPALAALCLEHAVEEHNFEAARMLLKMAPAVKNIPDITIKGEKFGMPGAYFHKLSSDDIRGPFLGEIVDCCQSIGGHGNECAQHGVLSPDSGFYVVENAKGQIIGETWAWRGTKGEMCFDSLETLGGQVSGDAWEKILKECVKELTSRKGHDITGLTVGKGGATPQKVCDAFTAISRNGFLGHIQPAKPKNYTGYRDSSSQVLVQKFSEAIHMPDEEEQQEMNKRNAVFRRSAANR